MRLASSLIFAVILLSAAPREAAAQSFRAHLDGSAARAISGYQETEFGWGGAISGQAEMVFLPQLGVIAGIGGMFLNVAQQPTDPTLAPNETATSIWGGLGLRYDPFAKEKFVDQDWSAGFWLSGEAGFSATGQWLRPIVDFKVGYDFAIDGGWVAMGPMVGYHHTFQSDSALRPDDANILQLGFHLMFDGAHRETEAKPKNLDRDGDGIPDATDQCPDEAEDIDGFQDEDGCPELDNDQDGVPDIQDRCPLEAEDIDGFQDDDGCPDPDNDGDGIVDALDQCPNEAEDMDGFQDEDGCPDLDNDGDGILDRDDACPNEPEVFNGYADHDGCPDAEQIRVVGDHIVLDDRVHFQTNSAVIRIVSYPLLERLAGLLNEHPEYLTIEIQGHTDNRGPELFNQRLSEQRARAVLEFLVERGHVERSKLSHKGYGSKQPMLAEDTENAWFMNRRVDIIVTKEIKEVLHTSQAPRQSLPPTDTSKSKAGKASAEKSKSSGSEAPSEYHSEEEESYPEDEDLEGIHQVKGKGAK